MADCVRARGWSLGREAITVLVAVLATFLLVYGRQANAAPAQSDDGVLRATLTNGLRVIIVRNTLAPVVATSVNYLVGSDEAPDGFPGMAHAQEHMMFRGSPGLSADQLANIGSIMGGNFNANTRESLTQYLYTVPSEDLDIALNIEALRMRDVLDTQQDWDKERGAIEQEVAQDLSSPFYILYSKLRAKMFAGTPYEHDALGTRPSFDKTSSEMLKQFHDLWYAPNNAILIIVGNVEPQATLTKVRELFSAIPTKPLPARPSVTPQPLAPVAFTVPTDQPEATEIIALRIPGLDSPDFPALELLSDVLSSQSYELYGLVAQGKAISAEFALNPLPKAGLSYAAVSFPAAADSKSIDIAVRAILAKAAREGVPADLVEAAKIQERRETEFQKNSIAGLASVWADAVSLYGLASPEEDLARIEKVTVADVNRVARKYIDLAHAVSATMVPQRSGEPAIASAGFGGQETISLGEGKPTELPAWAQGTLARLTPPDSTLHPVVSKLNNGLTLIVQPEDISDTVTVYGRIHNRAEVEELPGKEGASLVLDPLLSFGTKNLDRLAFQKELDKIGASEKAGTDFAIKMLAGDFDRGVELLADNEINPALPQPVLDNLKIQIADTVKSRNKSPSYLSQRSLLKALYPVSDPILREATPQTVRSLTREDIAAYYGKVFRPDLTTIVVVGKVTPEQARDVVSRYFGNWGAQGPRPNVDLAPSPKNRPSVVAVPDVSRVQNSVTLAQTLALGRSDPDYYPLFLGNAVLGGGFYSTRLSIDLRKNLGLVYSVESDLQAARLRSAYIVEYASDPQNVTRAADIAAQELKKMQDKPVAEDELTRAKALLIRQIPLAESSIDEIAQGLASRNELGLALDEPTRAAQRYIDLRPIDVQEAFQKWIRPGDLARVSQGPTQ